MVEERSARWAACIYIIQDEGSVAVTATEFREEELTLDDVRERIRIENPSFDDNLDQIQGFVIHPKAWPWLQKIEWPESPYDSFDTDWDQTVDQCKLSVYKACKV